jgi:hypothetical protein
MWRDLLSILKMLNKFCQENPVGDWLWVLVYGTGWFFAFIALTDSLYNHHFWYLPPSLLAYFGFSILMAVRIGRIKKELYTELDKKNG